MKISNFFALTLLAAGLAACSSTSSEQKQDKIFDYKAAAIRARPLDVPPEFTGPTANDRYSIPGMDGVARYSDYAKGGGGSNVLPVSRTVTLMRNGTQRWLLVNDRPENLWPLIKAFWQDNGLTIKVDDPAAGILETDWAENKAKVWKNPSHGFFAKLYDTSKSSSGELDQYHTRLERSKDGQGTEIYIKQSGLKEVKDSTPDAYVASYKWLPRDPDPELEATMLQLLMARLSGTSPTAAAAVARPAVQMVTAADGSKRIQLSEAFDKSWRKVALALDQAKLVLDDKDRSKGVFYLRGSKPGEAWLQVNLKENAAGCELSVTDSKSSSTPQAQQILDTLYPLLSKL